MHFKNTRERGTVRVYLRHERVYLSRKSRQALRCLPEIGRPYYSFAAILYPDVAQATKDYIF
jgi:hypothetical protein